VPSGRQPGPAGRRKPRGWAAAGERGTGGLAGPEQQGAAPQGGIESGAGEPGARPVRAGPGTPGPGGAEASAEEAARAVCLRLLAAAPRTRAQLATAMRRRRIPDEVAESVLGRFAEVGLIDDAAFARAWVESRHHGRGLARRALAAELRQRGVPDGEVRSAVGMLRPEDEMAAARRLAAKRAAASRGQPAPARVRQLMGMLARRGYPAGLAAQVVRETLASEAAESPGASTDLALFWQDGADDNWP